jgi:POT family proton-dependent oligopeptide transporter
MFAIALCGDRLIIAILLGVAVRTGGGSLNLFTEIMSTVGGVPASTSSRSIAIYIMIARADFRVALWISWRAQYGAVGAGQIRSCAASARGLASCLRVGRRSTMGMQANLTPVVFVFLLYLLHTTGELCLSPVGLSAMNRLAPRIWRRFSWARGST